MAMACSMITGLHVRERKHQVAGMQAVYGDTLPWPLNYIIPFSTSMSIKKRFKDVQSEKVRLHHASASRVQVVGCM